MSGETDLNSLLKKMHPVLDGSEYIFYSLDPDSASSRSIQALLAFREKEGLTVVVTAEQAQAMNLSYDLTWAWIELTVHSSLTAIGFIAAVSHRLAQAGISLNVVSAYYHDHLFVPWESREAAMQLLQEMSAADPLPGSA